MEKCDYYIRQFSQMIQIPTISYYEKNVEEPFETFRALLPKLFPHLMAIADMELFSGSILLRWKGKNAQNPILFMNHHDVVTAEEGWSHEPFGAEVTDGKLYGRGTLDTKGGLWAMLQAADELCGEGFQPNQDIYFLSSCNEETTFAGSCEISQVLKKRGIHFSLVLDEGGMILYEPIGGAKDYFAMIGCGERGCVDLQFTAKSKGGHASSPEKNAPLVRLGQFMADADRRNLFQVQLERPILEMFRRMAPTVSGPLRLVYAQPTFFMPLLKKIMPKVSATSRALVETTLAFTMAKGAERCSIMPNEASVCCNMRFSHHQGYESSLASVTKLAQKYGLETTVLDPGGESKLSAYDCKEFRFIEDAVRQAFPQVRTSPYIMTGCSDARYLTNLSDYIYHFTPFIIDEKQLESIHGIDENVDIANLVPAVEFFKYMMTEAKTLE